MNDAFGSFAFVIYLVLVFGAIWLTVALWRAVFRTARATEETVRLLQRLVAVLEPTGAKAPPAVRGREAITIVDRVAAVLEPPRAEAPPALSADEVIRPTDIKTKEEAQAWKDGRIKTKTDLEMFRSGA